MAISFWIASAAAALSLFSERAMSQDVCSCSPSKYSFTLDLSLTCPPVNVTRNPGIAATFCQISPFGNAGSEIEDLVPVEIENIEILELGQEFEVLSQQNITGLSVDGDTFDYTSIVANEGNEDITKVIQLNIFASNAGGEPIVNFFAISFSNVCDEFPALIEGESAGWVHFTKLEPPATASCPAVSVGVPTDSPQISGAPSASVTDPSDVTTGEPSTSVTTDSSDVTTELTSISVTDPSVVTTREPSTSVTTVPSGDPTEAPTTSVTTVPSGDPTGEPSTFVTTVTSGDPTEAPTTSASTGAPTPEATIVTTIVPPMSMDMMSMDLILARVEESVLEWQGIQYRLVEKEAKSEKSEKSVKAEKESKEDKSVKSNKTEKEKKAKSEKSEKSTKTEKESKEDKVAKSNKGEKDKKEKRRRLRVRPIYEAV